MIRLMRGRVPFILLFLFWISAGVLAPQVVRVCQAKASAAMASHPCCKNPAHCVDQWTPKPCCEGSSRAPVSTPAYTVKSGQDSFDFVLLGPSNLLFSLQTKTSNIWRKAVDEIPKEPPRFLQNHSFLC